MKFLYKSVSNLTHQRLKFQQIWFSSSRYLQFHAEQIKKSPCTYIDRIYIKFASFKHFQIIFEKVRIKATLQHSLAENVLKMQ
jgi:hypothetical protein